MPNVSPAVPRAGHSVNPVRRSQCESVRMLSDGQGELPSAQKIEFCCLNGTISQLTTLGAIGQRERFAFRRVAHEQKIPLETRLRLTFADPSPGEWLTYASPESVVICCSYAGTILERYAQYIHTLSWFGSGAVISPMFQVSTTWLLTLISLFLQSIPSAYVYLACSEPLAGRLLWHHCRLLGPQDEAA